jgi:hypothetical protein
MSTIVCFRTLITTPTCSTAAGVDGVYRTRGIFEDDEVICFIQNVRKHDMHCAPTQGDHLVPARYIFEIIASSVADASIDRMIDV